MSPQRRSTITGGVKIKESVLSLSSAQKLDCWFFASKERQELKLKRTMAVDAGKYEPTCEDVNKKCKTHSDEFYTIFVSSCAEITHT